MRLGWQRRCLPSRRAYFPRFWPIALAGAVPTWLLCAGLHFPPLFSALTGALVGDLICVVRMSIWKRRHPVIPTHEQVKDLMDAKREAAPWN